MTEITHHKAGPPPPGHITNAVRAGGFVFVSGQGPIDPASGVAVSGDIKAKVRRSLRNVELALRGAGSDLQHVVKTTVWLESWDHYVAVNEVYAEFWPRDPPARSVVVGPRPPGQLVAIEAIAISPS